MNKRPIPDWIQKFPQTPLSEVLHGKVVQYSHVGWCSGSKLKPIGHPNSCCLCLSVLRKGL
jgi:hypothetical protein